MKNWKTTVLGTLGGLTGASMVGWTKPDGGVNWLAVGFAVIASARGYYSKDKDVTGAGASATVVKE